MQRKVFRVEQMLTPRPRRAPQTSKPPQNAAAPELTHVLDTIRRSEAELASLCHDTRLPRLRDELGAAITGMADATQKILSCAESIDEKARALASQIKGDFGHGLAQDVLDLVTRIYEASNFQDIAGQRISKAMAALTVIERQISALNDIWGGVVASPNTVTADQALLNGPKLSSDSGHANQDDIDRLFG